MRYILVLLTIGNCWLFNTTCIDLPPNQSSTCTVPKDNQETPVTIIIQNRVNQETDVAQRTNTQTQVENTNINQNDLTLQQQLNNFISDTKESTSNFINGFVTWIQQNRLRAAGTCVISSYVFINVMLCYYAFYVSRKAKWTSWKKEISNAQFFAIAHSELQQQLLVSIHQQCADTQNPIEPSRALAKFIEEINQEIHLLARYKKLLYFSQKMPLSRCVAKWHSYEKIAKLHERLVFIKQLFFSWLASYNCNQT